MKTRIIVVAAISFILFSCKSKEEQALEDLHNYGKVSIGTFEKSDTYSYIDYSKEITPPKPSRQHS